MGSHIIRQGFQKEDSLYGTLISLTHLLPYKQEMGATEFSHKLGSYKETISRDIQNLVTNGFPNQNSQTEKCVLGSSQRLMSNKDFPLAKESIKARLYM